MAVTRPPPIPAPGSHRIGDWALHEALLASQWVIPIRSFETLICRPYLSCRGSLPLALGFELPRGSGYGFYVVAGCDGQNRLAARCPATTRPLIERCDLDRCVRTR